MAIMSNLTPNSLSPSTGLRTGLRGEGASAKRAAINQPVRPELVERCIGVGHGGAAVHLTPHPPLRLRRGGALLSGLRAPGTETARSHLLGLAPAAVRRKQGSRGRSPCAGAVGGVPPHFSPSTARAEQTARDAQRDAFDGNFRPMSVLSRGFVRAPRLLRLSLSVDGSQRGGCADDGEYPHVGGQHATSDEGGNWRSGGLGKDGAGRATDSAVAAGRSLSRCRGTAALSGELEARFDGENRARVHASGPLELRGPLTASKLYYLRNVAAGVFEGDTYRTLLHCAAGAQARFESPSATKVYSMPSRGATTSVELCAEGGSRLVWGPHATILHTGSSLRTDTRVTLHVGARVLMAETLVMGRIAAGQRFDFASYGSSLIVQDGRGDVLCREAFSLTPGPGLEAAMGGFGVLTCFYALGAFEPWEVERLPALCAVRPLAGLSALPSQSGYVVKALSETMPEGISLARQCLKALLPDTDVRAMHATE